MSWLDALGQIGPTLAGGYEGAMAYGRGAIMRAAAAAGASGAQVLQAMRGAGLGFREQQFYQVWNVYRSQVASAATASSIPLEVASGAPLTGQVPEGWTGQYTHSVTGIIRERTETGGYALRSITRYMVSPTIMSPEQAAATFTDVLLEPNERGQSYIAQVSDLLTTSLTGLWYRTGAIRFAGL